MKPESNLAKATTWVISQDVNIAVNGMQWTLLVDEAVERFDVDIEDLNASICAKLKLKVPPPSPLRPQITFQQGMLTIGDVDSYRMPTLTFEDREIPDGAVIDGHYVCKPTGVSYPYGSSPQGFWAADGLGWGIWLSEAERDLALCDLAEKDVSLPSPED